MNELFKELLVEFNTLVKVKGYKTGNGQMYQSVVKEFLTHQTKRGKVDTRFTQKDMILYYEYLTKRPNKRRSGSLSERTINHHLFGIGLFFDYLLETKREEAMPVIPKYLRSSAKEMEILTVDEIKELYQKANGGLETALLSTAYGAGLRRSELEKLNITDVIFRDAILIVKHGKNDKRREVPLSDKVVKDLKDYLHNYRCHTNRDRKAFFVNQQRNRMRGASMNQMIQRITRRTTIEKQVSLHTLRRSIATHLAENGAGIYFIKDFLGHSHIDTSHLYAIRRKRQHKLKQ